MAVVARRDRAIRYSRAAMMDREALDNCLMSK